MVRDEIRLSELGILTSSPVRTTFEIVAIEIERTTQGHTKRPDPETTAHNIIRILDTRGLIEGIDQDYALGVSLQVATSLIEQARVPNFIEPLAYKRTRENLRALQTSPLSQSPETTLNSSDSVPNGKNSPLGKLRNVLGAIPVLSRVVG